MTNVIPDDFGGFVGYWHDGRAIIVRYGEGQPREAVRATPLNLLQLQKLVAGLIEQGTAEGHITAEHQQQSSRLPQTQDLNSLMPRAEVDEIAGTD